MKTNIINRALRWILLFTSTIFNQQFLTTVSAQTVSKTFTDEIEVSEDVDVITNGPNNFYLSGHGKICLKESNGAYELTTANNEEPMLIIQDYKIHTWDENKVKQVVELDVTGDAKSNTNVSSLLNDLELDLELSPSGEIRSKDHLNITECGYENGFFKKDANWVVLNNGQKYNIKSIRIKSTLYIPRNSNLDASIERLGFQLGDLNGKAKLDISRSNFSAGNLKNVEANFHNSDVKIKAIVEGVINAKNSEINVDKVGRLDIGSAKLASEGNYFCKLETGNKNSSLAKYNIDFIDTLYINNSTNDNVNISNVGVLKASNSTFTDYHIDHLRDGLNIKAKNGDLHISSIGESFEAIQIDNQVSAINLDLGSTPNYKIELFESEYTDHIPPANAVISSESTFGVNKTYISGDADKAGTIRIQCNSCDLHFM